MHDSIIAIYASMTMGTITIASNDQSLSRKEAELQEIEVAPGASIWLSWLASLWNNSHN